MALQKWTWSATVDIMDMTAIKRQVAKPLLRGLAKNIMPATVASSGDEQRMLTV